MHEDIKTKIDNIANNMKYVYEKGVKDGAGTHCLSVKHTYDTSFNCIVTENTVNNALEEKDSTKEGIQVISFDEVVTKLGPKVFKDFVNTSVIIPLYRENSVGTVEPGAFTNCSALQQLDLRQCMNFNGPFVEGCTSLKNLWLNSNSNASYAIPSLTTIPGNACKRKAVQAGYTFVYVGDVDKNPVYIRDVYTGVDMNNYPGDLGDFLGTVKYLEHADDGCTNITIPATCKYARDFLRFRTDIYDVRTMFKLSIHSFNDLYLCELVGAERKYANNHMLKIDHATFRNSNLIENSLRQTTFEFLILRDCTLNVNCLRESTCSNKLTLKGCFIDGVSSLRESTFGSIDIIDTNIDTNTLRSSTVDNLTITNPKYIEGSAFIRSQVANFTFKDESGRYKTDGDRGIEDTYLSDNPLVAIVPKSAKFEFTIKSKRVNASALDGQQIKKITIGDATHKVDVLPIPFNAQNQELREMFVSNSDTYRAYNSNSLYTDYIDANGKVTRYGRLIKHASYASNVLIHDDCKEICSQAISYNIRLHPDQGVVWIPNSVTTIANDAFLLTRLYHVSIPLRFKPQIDELTKKKGRLDFFGAQPQSAYPYTLEYYEINTITGGYVWYDQFGTRIE